MEILAKPATPRLATLTERPGFVFSCLALLSERLAALEEGIDPRRKAIRLKELREEGVEDKHLLWLHFHAYVEHYRSTGALNSEQTHLELVESVQIKESSFYALTKAGEHFANSFLSGL